MYLRGAIDAFEDRLEALASRVEDQVSQRLYLYKCYCVVVLVCHSMSLFRDAGIYSGTSMYSYCGP